MDRQIATDVDDHELVNPAVAASQTPSARRQRWRRRPRPAAPAATATKLVPPAETMGEFDISRPGRAHFPGRGQVWTVRLALVIAPLVLTGGAAYAVGVSAGSARITASSTVSNSEADRYHLTTYPASQAAAYGATYLTLCLTHPDPQDRIAVADRLAGLARMVSNGVSAGCGWDGTGPPQQPLSVIWDGTAMSVANSSYTTGQAAQLGFLVTYVGGRTGGVSVPIWTVADDSSRGMRIVGDIAVMPSTPPVAAPTANAAGVVDSQLSQSLPDQVLLPFLRAWASSDTVQLNLVLTTNATPVARTGLDGQVSAPTINRAQVLTTNPEATAGDLAYSDGDVVTALVSVDWAAGAGSVQRAAYTITLHRSAGRWQVDDIAGAAPDPAGGAATTTTYSTP